MCYTDNPSSDQITKWESCSKISAPTPSHTIMVVHSQMQ